ncbi:MAG: UDP-N-acetylglucosamine 2-epimerase, partial [Planctomycetota bacterium]
FHFVATEESKQRVIRMGEREEFVWVTGAPSLDNITEGLPETREEVCQQLGLKKAVPFILVLFHPVVAEAQDAFRQTQELINTLSDIAIIGGRHIIWLDPNADAGSHDIISAISTVSGSSWRRITHLARNTYLAALKHCDVLVGNSSSGIVEAASFGTPVVNIGSRQNLRQRNINTIDCVAQQANIKSAIVRALERGRMSAMNIYGNGTAGSAIVKLLAQVPVGRNVPEKFNTY